MTTRHEEHDGEGDDVPQVGDGEAEVRRDEEEVEGDDAEHRREQRRPVPEAHRHDDDAEQVHHHDVGQLLVPEAVPADRACDAVDDGRRRRLAAERARGRRGSSRADRRRRRVAPAGRR